MKKLIYKIKKINHTTKLKLLAILIILVIGFLSFFVVPLKEGETFFHAMIHKNELFESLSADRQELYDKMKIEYIIFLIKQRNLIEYN